MTKIFLKGHTGGIRGVAVTPDGKMVISASFDKTLKIWKLPGGQQLRTLEGHLDSVNAVAVTLDGKKVISVSSDKTLKVWDLESGQLLRSFATDCKEIITIAVTPDDRQVVSGSWENTLKVWDLESGMLVRELEGHRDSIHAVVVTPDGRIIVSASWDRTLKVWDLRTGRCIRSLEGSIFDALAVTSDGRKIISGSLDKTIEIWDLKSGRQQRSLQGHTNTVAAVTVTPDGKKVISASNDNTLKIWELERGKLLHSLEKHTDQVRAVAVTPDGCQVVSGSVDRSIKIWDLETGRLLRSLDGVIKSDADKPLTVEQPVSVPLSLAHQWIRRGQTLFEKAAERQANLGQHVMYTALFDPFDLVKAHEAGVFSMFIINGYPSIIAKTFPPLANDEKAFQRNIELGRVIFITSCFSYPSYSLVYNRVFIPIGNDTNSFNGKGIIIESLTDFTEANFQEWVITVEKMKKTAIEVYNESGGLLAHGEITLGSEIIPKIIQTIDQANTLLGKIPSNQRDFTAASKAFYKDHPEPFIL